MTDIRRCKCKHDWQDKRYGKGMRVHNSYKKGNDAGARCTVCNDEK